MAVEIIGITGGIGSGKSVVSRILRCCGFTVYDCDSEAKKLMTCNYMVKDCLINLFGDSVYHPSGELNKTLIADKLFSDNDIRVQVNAIVHRAVRNDIPRGTYGSALDQDEERTVRGSDKDQAWKPRSALSRGELHLGGAARACGK